MSKKMIPQQYLGKNQAMNSLNGHFHLHHLKNHTANTLEIHLCIDSGVFLNGSRFGRN